MRLLFPAFVFIVAILCAIIAIERLADHPPPPPEASRVEILWRDDNPPIRMGKIRVEGRCYLAARDFGMVSVPCEPLPEKP